MSRIKNEFKSKITNDFVEAVREYSKEKRVPLWKLASDANLHPSRLSNALSGDEMYEPELLKIGLIAYKIGFKKNFRAIQEPVA